MKRIVMHWTAGSHNASAVDREHYHVIVQGDGRVVYGNKKPEANESTADGDYAAHVRALNTGSIGIAVAAMFNARERPFDAGPYPITEAQYEAFVKAVADLAATYKIPISPETVLTHAEVEPTLGVAQRGKWDITWLPGMADVQSPRAVGDRIRRDVMAAMRGPILLTNPEPKETTTMDLKIRDWWDITRKLKAGGIGGVIAVAAVWAINNYIPGLGDVLQPQIEAAIGAFGALLAAYMTADKAD